MKYAIRKENWISARQQISNVAMLSNYAPVPELVRRDLVRSIAELLSQSKVETIKKDFVTEYRIELYAFTPDEFYQAVQAEAQEMMHWFDRPVLPYRTTP